MGYSLRFVFLVLIVNALCFEVAAQWSIQTSGTANNLRSVHFINANEGWAVGLSGTILHTIDGGVNWSPQTSGTTENLLGVRAIDASVVWTAGARALGRTTDGGVNWGVSINPAPTFFINTIFAVSSTVAWSPSLFTGSERHFSRFTVTGPMTIVEDVFDSVPSTSPFLDIYLTDVNNAWAVGFGQIRRITNASSGSPGLAFQTSGTAQTLNGIHMADLNNGWIAANNGTILHTTNGGTNWTPQTNGVPANSFFDVFFDVDLMHGWAVGSSGTIIATINGGAGWFPENSGVGVTLRSVFGSGGVVYAVGDGGTIVVRRGPTAASGAVSGRITTPDGTPVAGAVINLIGSQSRKTITNGSGNYQFENVLTDGFYTVTPSRANYNFSPASRSFSQIGNRTEGAFTADSTGDAVNPLDTPEYFVRQQYVDILGREPDEDGFNYWSEQILACGADASCVNTRRRDVAAAFFIENEFRQSGAFIYNLYQDALGRRPVYSEYSADRRDVVGGPTLEAQKQAFAEAFVARAEFAARYQSNTTAESFVDALLANAQQVSGADLSSQRDSLISRYNTGASQAESRTLVLRDVTESAAVRDANYNAAFVAVEYFGYLHRNPDQGGYDFWLNVLNESSRNGDPTNHRGMVCSFITSAEYQHRFSVVVSHSNSECQ